MIKKQKSLEQKDISLEYPCISFNEVQKKLESSIVNISNGEGIPFEKFFSKILEKCND